VGLGKALLATREELRRLYPGRNLPALTERSVTTVLELERELAKVRRFGFARSRGESADSVGSIAVAVTDRHGVGRAAVSVAAPLTRVTSDNERLWVAAARAVADRLGARLWGEPELL
jgi:DNA-binding IclR family transcriptional regulator